MRQAGQLSFAGTFIFKTGKALWTGKGQTGQEGRVGRRLNGGLGPARCLSYSISAGLRRRKGGSDIHHCSLTLHQYSCSSNLLPGRGVDRACLSPLFFNNASSGETDGEGTRRARARALLPYLAAGAFLRYWHAVWFGLRDAIRGRSPRAPVSGVFFLRAGPTKRKRRAARSLLRA